MERTVRNFWLDVFLFLLLGMDIALVILSPRTPAGGHPGFGWHAHAFISVLLTFGCLMHIMMHRTWFQAALSGKSKSKVALIKNSIVTIMMLIAALSGHEAFASGGLHKTTGILAMIGLSMHGIKHVRWMAIMSKRIVTSGSQKNTVPSA